MARLTLYDSASAAKSNLSLPFASKKSSRDSSLGWLASFARSPATTARVSDGEDESLALVAADGTTSVADITVVSTEDGQRFACTLASAVPKGMYYVRLGLKGSATVNFA